MVQALNVKSVSHNTILYTGASIIQKALSFVYYWIIARSFGPEGVGQYSYALAFAALFSILIDGGLTPVLIRGCAQPNQQGRAWLVRILQYKFLIALATSFVMIGIVLWVSGRAFMVWPLILVAGLTMLMDTVNTTMYGVLRAHQLLKFESIGLIASQAVVLVGGVVIFALHLPVIVAIMVLAVGSVLNGGIAMRGVWRVLSSQTPRQEVEPLPALGVLAKQAAPFMLAGIFARTYSFFDSFYLAEVSKNGFAGLGVYSTANKITFAFQFIPLALIASLYPAFSYAGSAADRALLWVQAQRYVMLCAGGISALLISLRLPLLDLFGTGFSAGSTAMLILALSLPFSFMSYPNGALLNALHLSRLQTTAMGVTVLVNVGVNILLVGRYGVVGAAIAALCGNMTLWAMGAYFAHKCEEKLSVRDFCLSAGRIYGAGAVAAALTSLLVLTIPAPFRLVTGGITGVIVYVGGVLLFRAITIAELKQAWRMIRSRI